MRNLPMCNCIGLCRTFDETPPGVQPSIHHPNCEDYELLPFKKISYVGGGSLTVRNEQEVSEFVASEVENGAQENDFEVSTLLLTLDQFESMPEFDGF